ncbi:MAG TPA: EF-P beta-lysylation protein EpmB [Gammaproteobacteria bacterium]|nr:EF-P beta-lysylation protein EpmB [Gammaproteobacteria bacterium]
MIPQTTVKRQLTHWQDALKQVITDPKELLSRLNLPVEQALNVYDLNFPCRVPLQFVELMEKGNPHDPLLKQVLPTVQESLFDKNANIDPLQEKNMNPIPGLLHKYQGRILLTLTKHCAIHCRYCFRRYFPYEKNQLSKDNWAKIMTYLHERSEVYEVILSGGDPLSVPDRLLAKMIQEIEQVSHIQALRIHTRLGVVIPERLCTELFRTLSETRLQLIIVFHCNHPNEISKEFANRLVILKQQLPFITLLNQAVLLKGVNDTLPTLTTLCQSLFKIGILPYYVHSLDPTPGSQHFKVNPDEAKVLQNDLLATLPGYLVPRFVTETPYHANKVPIF